MISERLRNSLVEEFSLTIFQSARNTQDFSVATPSEEMKEMTAAFDPIALLEENVYDDSMLQYQSTFEFVWTTLVETRSSHCQVSSVPG